MARWRLPGTKILTDDAHDKQSILFLLTCLSYTGPQLKVIATHSVGLEHIDVALCQERGVSVGYTPGVSTTATAETALVLVLGTAKRLEECKSRLFGWLVGFLTSSSATRLSCNAAQHLRLKI